jgi:hypothetical protein
MSPNVKQILKLVIFIILLFIAFIFIAALIVNNEYSVERSVVIDKPKQEVFDYIRYLSNQEEYSVWYSMDPDIRQQYRGTDGTVGFVSSWEGNNEVGKGEQEIVGITEGERIDTQLRFIEPFEGIADAYMITEVVNENQTRVTWGFESSMPRPMNLILLFLNMENLIGEDYQTGLENLKVILEREHQNSNEIENGEAGSD